MIAKGCFKREQHVAVDFYEERIKRNKERIDKMKVKSLTENSGVAFVTFVSHECVIETIGNF